MTEPTLRELCERVIEAWDARFSPDGGTPAHWDECENACRALSERLREKESHGFKVTAETILAALDADREAGSTRGFVDAMSEMTFSDRELPTPPVEQIETPPSDPDR